MRCPINYFCEKMKDVYYVPLRWVDCLIRALRSSRKGVEDFITVGVLVLLLFCSIPVLALPPSVIMETIETDPGHEFRIAISRPKTGFEVRFSPSASSRVKLLERIYDEVRAREILTFLALSPGEEVIPIKVLRSGEAGAGQVFEQYRFRVTIRPDATLLDPSPDSPPVEIYPYLDDERTPLEEPSEGERYQSTDIEVSGVDPLLLRQAGEEERNMFQLAEQIFQRGYYTRAIEEYQKILYTYPKGVLNELVALRVGDAYYQEGMKNFLEAKEDKKNRRKDEAIAGFQRSRSLFQKALEQYREVKQVFELGRFVLRAQYYVALSQSMIAKSDFEVDDYERSAKRKPNLEEFEEAIVEYLKVIVSDRSSRYADNARLNIGLYYKEMADYFLEKNYPKQTIREFYTRAIREFDGVVKDFPGTDGSGYALYNLAVIYDKILLMRDFKKAVDNYEQIYNLYKDYPNDPSLRNLARGVKSRMEEIRKEYL